MGDQYARDSLALQPLEYREEGGRFRLGEGRGRLVEHEQSRFFGERPRYGDELKLASIEVPELGLRIEVQLYLLEPLDRLAPHLGPINASYPIDRPSAHKHVLGDREVEMHIDLLVDHGDPGRLGLACIGETDLFPVYRDSSIVCIGGVGAAQDFHEGRLARSILADDRQYFPGPCAKAHIVEGQHARELLGDAAHFE